MRTTQRLFTLAVLASILGLASCKKDDESSGQLSKNDAKEKLNEFNSTTVNDLQDLTDADGLTAVKDLLNLVDTDDPFGRVATDKHSIKKFFHEKGQALKKVFVAKDALNGRTKSNEAFDFASKLGIYEWLPADSIFAKTGESEMIQILFPTTGSETNNAELRIEDYQEEAVIETDEDGVESENYEPTKIKASLLVNEITVASVDFTLDWDEHAFPVTAKISVFVSPFTLAISFDNSNSGSSSLSASLKRDQETIAAVTVTANFENNTKNEDNLTTLEGFVQFRNIKVKGLVDVKAADESAEGDPNEYIHLALYDSDRKIGDIVFVNEEVDGDEQYVAYVKYADGTKEKLEDVIKPVLDEINNLTDGLNDNG